ncbi:molybdenum cofactor biosynthesis protein MoaE [Alcanivorax sp. VBW004]|jgi:molybdopterin synthase catalytic subunit|uniref:molybdenum cofactor biosynthesis protein MoaE n=1 Tax=unclassified Alcanivorax TaxID=2638842 RepID=UPI00017EB237|nr:MULTISPECIES: molybdenum cofactor biosynthesis protein MoaE [unclassified Alcanivorax]EDX89597.1 molybdopterin converting factor, subunit 2 [Alcanivorax sp. DG881]MTT53549.1 molybdenum cofactor biosynthesis protein MoaE [Alcanivorax sp. VBW004]
MKIHVAVTDTALVPAQPSDWLRDAGLSGAMVQFSGQVRDEQGRVEALHLEHYPGMTEGVLRTIVDQAGQKWHLNGAWVVHRIGTMVVADDIVQVAVSAPHRQDAFAACAFIMDLLKTRAPFWKKELIDGRWIWVEARQSDDEAAAAWLQAASAREPS